MSPAKLIAKYGVNKEILDNFIELINQFLQKNIPNLEKHYASLHGERIVLNLKYNQLFLDYAQMFDKFLKYC